MHAILTTVAGAPAAVGDGRSDLRGALHRVDAIARRRGFVAIVADFDGTDWSPPLGRLGQRHDLLAITVHDPRERDLPEIGLVQFEDPATGEVHEYRITADVRRQFADAAAAQVIEQHDLLGRAGADVIDLSTDGDWLAEVVHHVTRRRIQAVRGQVIGR